MEPIIQQLPESLSSVRLLVVPSRDVFTWLGDQFTKKSLLKSPVETTEADASWSKKKQTIPINVIMLDIIDVCLEEDIRVFILWVSLHVRSKMWIYMYTIGLQRQRVVFKQEISLLESNLKVCEHMYQKRKY